MTQPVIAALNKKTLCPNCGCDKEVWKEALGEEHKCITISIPRPWERKEA